MDIASSVILGVVEGITEFLPISSTGHLILASNLLRIEQTEFVKTFEIAIQSGAILSVVFLYRRTIFHLSFLNSQLSRRVFIAFIPTAIIGFLLYKVIKQYLIGNTHVVLLSLLVGGIVLIAVELFFRKSEIRISKSEANSNHKSYVINYKSISYERAFVIGLFQSISMIPGVSRAAATIIGGMLVGLPRKTAVEFSFLLAIPTMLAATALDLNEASLIFDSNEWVALVIGFITSFIVALIAIRWLVKYVQNHNFIAFGIYRIIFSIIYFLVFLS